MITHTHRPVLQPAKGPQHHKVSAATAGASEAEQEQRLRMLEFQQRYLTAIHESLELAPPSTDRRSTNANAACDTVATASGDNVTVGSAAGGREEEVRETPGNQAPTQVVCVHVCGIDVCVCVCGYGTSGPLEPL